MTKAILISIRPEHVVNILNGKKTLELRKTVPKDFVGWVYIYCTKAQPNVWNFYNEPPYYIIKDYTYKEMLEDGQIPINGKIVGMFLFNKHYIFKPSLYSDVSKGLGYLLPINIINELQLNQKLIDDYGNGKRLYAWEITRLKIFAISMELKDFGIKRPPQSWQYIQVKTSKVLQDLRGSDKDVIHT